MQSIIDSVQKETDRASELLSRTWEYKKAHPYAFAAAMVASSILGHFVVKLAQRYVKGNTIIEISFDTHHEIAEIVDQTEQWLKPNKIEFRKLLESLEVAAKDKRVIGIIARISTLSESLDPPHIAELGQVLRQFKLNGKKSFAIFEAETGSESLSMYLLASYFDKIYMPECCILSLTGMRVDIPFFKNMLSKLGIEAEIEQRKQYKNGADMFTHEKFNEPYRESVVSLYDEYFHQIAVEIAKNRNWDLETAKKILTEGPYYANRALELKIVDQIAYGEEIYENLQSLFGVKKPNLLFLDKYAKKTAHLAPYSSGKPLIGLITLEGAVQLGDVGGISSDPTIAAIRAARENKHLKAVVIRVNSGGGSYVASDEIAREVKKLAETKKVVVSMSLVAGSGGYYVSMNAHKIFATPDWRKNREKHHTSRDKMESNNHSSNTPAVGLATASALKPHSEVADLTASRVRVANNNSNNPSDGISAEPQMSDDIFHNVLNFTNKFMPPPPTESELFVFNERDTKDKVTTNKVLAALAYVLDDDYLNHLSSQGESAAGAFVKFGCVMEPLRGLSSLTIDEPSS